LPEFYAREVKQGGIPHPEEAQGLA